MSRNGLEWTRKPDLSTGLYVDPRIYTDLDIFAEEKSKIFDKAWLIACHESEVQEALDYRTYQHPGGHNLIVLRGEDAVVRVFQNICPHRGNRLLYDVAGTIKGSSPSGAPDRITCIFHAWAFDARGNCVDIPRRKAGYQERLHECDVGLREVRCEVGYGGFVWVTMDDAAPDLASYLGGALDDLAPMLAEPMEIFHYHRAVVHGNYKMWHDTNSEFYHDYMHYHNRVTGMLKKEVLGPRIRHLPGRTCQTHRHDAEIRRLRRPKSAESCVAGHGAGWLGTRGSFSRNYIQHPRACVPP